MTIVAVVSVEEGIAMAADSRLIGTKSHPDGAIERYPISDNVQKLMLIQDSAIAIGVSGDISINSQMVTEFIKDFDREEVNKLDSVNTVALKLFHLLQSHRDNNTSFYVVGYDGKEPYVIHLNKDSMVRMNERDGQAIHSLSVMGEMDIANRIFKDTVFNLNLMPLKDALDLSTFLVDFTIKYSRFADMLATCDGPIDSLVVTRDGAKFIKHKLFTP